MIHELSKKDEALVLALQAYNIRACQLDLTRSCGVWADIQPMPRGHQALLLVWKLGVLKTAVPQSVSTTKEFMSHSKIMGESKKSRRNSNNAGVKISGMKTSPPEVRDIMSSYLDLSDQFSYQQTSRAAEVRSKPPRWCKVAFCISEAVGEENRRSRTNVCTICQGASKYPTKATVCTRTNYPEAEARFSRERQRDSLHCRDPGVLCRSIVRAFEEVLKTLRLERVEYAKFMLEDNQGELFKIIYRPLAYELFLLFRSNEGPLNFFMHLPCDSKEGLLKLGRIEKQDQASVSLLMDFLMSDVHHGILTVDTENGSSVERHISLLVWSENAWGEKMSLK